MLNKTFLIIWMLLAAAASLNGQSMKIGPQLGYYKAQGVDDWSFMAGVTWRLQFTDYIGAEASINFHQESYVNNLVTVHSLPVMITGLFYPLPPVMYGGIGVGLYNLTYDYDQSRLPLLIDETKQKLGWHLGGGLVLPVGSAVTLTADIRYVFLRYAFQAFPGSNDLKSNFTVITAGFLLDL